MNKIFITRADKQRSHEFLFFILSKYFGVKADESGLTKSKFGKLSLVDSSIRFNITHSGELIALAVGLKEVGLDVEKVKEKNHFLGKEIFGNTVNDLETFYTLWTKAESFVKYSASSILCDLKNIVIKPDGIYLGGELQNVCSKTFKYQDYIFSICSKDEEYEVYEINSEDF